MKKYIGYAICSILVMVVGYYFSLGMTALVYNKNNSSKEMALSAMAVFAVLFLIGVVVFSTFIIIKTIKENDQTK